MEPQINKRNQYTAEFKAKIAILALTNAQTISEIASTYKLHPTQIIKWKGQLQENAQNIFSDKRKKHLENKQELIEELYKTVGQRDIELDWLKKKVGLFSSRESFAP